MNIGVLGGTFDPIHTGHLIIAEEARTRLGLKEVLFVPAGQPWLKQGSDATPANHRVEMARLAIADNPRFRLCVTEVERHGPSYTVETMMALREQFGSEASLFFILGRDTLADLPVWREPAKLVQLCRLVVAPRLGSRDLKHLKAAMPGLLDEIVQLDMPLIEISSSGIRERVRSGMSIRYLVPQSVERYINEHGIYTASVE